MAQILKTQLLDTTRGRIVTLLRGGGLTADDIASKLGLTRSAIRVQITTMERDGVVTRVGKRPGTTRPSHVFELTAEVEQLLSNAYLPLLSHLVRVFADDLPAHRVDAILRRAGKSLAGELSGGKRFTGNLGTRVARASEMMNDQLGAMTHVERNGGYIIRGVGCPLAALTGKHPSVCVAMESLVTEIVGASVHECFVIAPDAPGVASRCHWINCQPVRASVAWKDLLNGVSSSPGHRAGSKSSMGFPSGSSIWICRPPGPVSMSLRK